MHNTGEHPDAEPDDMQPRSTDPDRGAVEQLLDGHSAGPDALRQLLAAARGSAVRADQAGLDQALADFAQYVSTPTAALSRPKTSLLKIVLARLAAAKMMVIVALAVIATGGIALAASTGTIPNPLPGSDHSTTTTNPTDTTSRPSGSSPSVRHQSTPADTPSTTTAPTSPTSTSPNSATTSAGAPGSFTGLCTSWLARPHTNGKADSSAAFQGLIAAAGGADAVDGYCTALLATATATASTTTTESSAPTATTTETTAPAGKKTNSNGKVTGKAP